MGAASDDCGTASMPKLRRATRPEADGQASSASLLSSAPVSACAGGTSLRKSGTEGSYNKTAYAGGRGADNTARIHLHARHGLGSAKVANNG